MGGSLRTGSYSASLAALTVHTLALRDVTVSRVSLADHPLPIYDADLEASSGIPEPARRLAALFGDHQGIFLSTPEYNASVPPILKNAIDWLSRVRRSGSRIPDPFKQRVFAIGSTSPGRFGGLRAQMHLRQILEVGLTATVIPEQITVTGAASAFAADGSFVDSRLKSQLDVVLDRFLAEAARHAG
jgi:chromate reductase, NAD(P)H dehydrogenase (quinone)